MRPRALGPASSDDCHRAAVDCYRQAEHSADYAERLLPHRHPDDPGVEEAILLALICARRRCDDAALWVIRWLVMPDDRRLARGRPERAPRPQLELGVS